VPAQGALTIAIGVGAGLLGSAEYRVSVMTLASNARLKDRTDSGRFRGDEKA
jgi:hypothetical protein